MRLRIAQWLRRLANRLDRRRNTVVYEFDPLSNINPLVQIDEREAVLPGTFASALIEQQKRQDRELLEALRRLSRSGFLRGPLW